MSKPALVDTDVIVDFLRGYPKAVDLVKTEMSRIIFPSIVVAELYAGVRGTDELASLDAFISLFRVIPTSAPIARAAGIHKRNYAKSHGVGLADAIIAATAEAEDADLYTLNTKHYPMFKTLQPPYTKT
jgi:predicted nucleic acid-binding protein